MRAIAGEGGALFWNMHRAHGEAGWKDKFRAKLETDLMSRELMFLMGNIHRLPDRWMIISLFYPPKRKQVAAPQIPLF